VQNVHGRGQKATAKGLLKATVFNKTKPIADLDIVAVLPTFHCPRKGNVRRTQPNREGRFGKDVQSVRFTHDFLVRGGEIQGPPMIQGKEGKAEIPSLLVLGQCGTILDRMLRFECSFPAAAIV
jgi:hypothetical protein